MTKTYALSSTEVGDEQKTVTISEQVTETRETKTSIAQLKEKIVRNEEQIKRLQEEINSTIDEMTAINTNTDISITDIPEKIALTK